MRPAPLVSHGHAPSMLGAYSGHVRGMLGACSEHARVCVESSNCRCSIVLAFSLFAFYCFITLDVRVYCFRSNFNLSIFELSNPEPDTLMYTSRNLQLLNFEAVWLFVCSKGSYFDVSLFRALAWRCSGCCDCRESAFRVFDFPISDVQQIESVVFFNFPSCV